MQILVISRSTLDTPGKAGERDVTHTHTHSVGRNVLTQGEETLSLVNASLLPGFSPPLHKVGTIIPTVPL